MNIKPRLIRYFWLYVLFILLMVTLPISGAQKLDNFDILSFRADYFLHGLLFVPWAFFQRVRKMKALAWLGLGLVFAAFSEGIQYFLTYRSFNINDMTGNASGVLIGFVPAWIWKRMKSRV